MTTTDFLMNVYLSGLAIHLLVPVIAICRRKVSFIDVIVMILTAFIWPLYLAYWIEHTMSGEE